MTTKQEFQIQSIHYCLSRFVTVLTIPETKVCALFFPKRPMPRLWLKGISMAALKDKSQQQKKKKIQIDLVLVFLIQEYVSLCCQMFVYLYYFCWTMPHSLDNFLHFDFLKTWKKSLSQKFSQFFVTKLNFQHLNFTTHDCLEHIATCPPPWLAL